MDYSQTKIRQLNVRDFVAYELPIFQSIDTDNPISSYIIAVHRRLERQERYLSPLTREKMLFFGQPIIIPYDKNDSIKITNKTIYEIISQQLERLLRKNTDISYTSNHALDCDDSLGQRYPFILKHVIEDGKKCSICPWNR
jgi:ubiquitin carboxyl-terminal hydrolase 6/32